jgi:pyridoxamine 5'-phosphate oxidase
MNKTEILAFINTNPTCFVATIENNKPHVRGLAMYKADETGIYFQTWKLKDISKQLTKIPDVELCFTSKDAQVRISGKLELVEDMALKQEVVAKRTFMKGIIEARGGWDIVAMYRMKKGKACVWTMATNFEPKTYIDI